MTKVKVTSNDAMYNEYKEGETGYIDGYVQGADSRPYAVVIIDKRIVMIPTHSLEAICHS